MNDVVLYSSFGWGQDDKNVITGADIGRYVAYLLEPRGGCARANHPPQVT